MPGIYEPKILLDCDVVIHFLKGGKIMELPTMPTDPVIVKEYFTLRKLLDEGESACLSVAKHNDYNKKPYT